MDGVIVYLTGLPGSGKSTLAWRLRRRLPACVLLDGDEVRQALVPRPGYDAAGRASFYLTMGGLAALLARQGHAVVLAATAPLRAHRDSVRAVFPRFIEVHVATPLEECARRDPKGLYARARAGEAPDLPGMGVAYEAPIDPEVVASGGDDEGAVAAVLDKLALLTRQA
jgi:adenylylsulfate kinase